MRSNSYKSEWKSGLCNLHTLIINRKSVFQSKVSSIDAFHLSPDEAKRKFKRHEVSYKKRVRNIVWPSIFRTLMLPSISLSPFDIGIDFSVPKIAIKTRHYRNYLSNTSKWVEPRNINHLSLYVGIMSKIQ